MLALCASHSGSRHKNNRKMTTLCVCVRAGACLLACVCQVSGGGAGRGHAEGPAVGEAGGAGGERAAEAAAGQPAGTGPAGAEEGRRRQVGADQPHTNGPLLWAMAVSCCGDAFSPAGESRWRARGLQD